MCKERKRGGKRKELKGEAASKFMIGFELVVLAADQTKNQKSKRRTSTMGGQQTIIVNTINMSVGEETFFDALQHRSFHHS